MSLSNYNRQRGSSALILLIVLVVTFGLILFTQTDLKSNLLSQFASSPQVEAIKNTPFVSANGTGLTVSGKDYQFIGVNAYELGTLPGVNGGCGGIIEDVDGFFSSLRPNSVVRFWAFQGDIATNIKTKQLDWTQFDRLVALAKAHNQRIIPVLADQSGQCDEGHWKDRDWYSGGYTRVYNDDGRGLAPLSFLDYAKAVASRYKDETSIAMWELISEPEPSDCPSGLKGEACYAKQTCADETLATNSLRSFYDTVGGQVKQIDANHLVESGVMGNGQCGGVFTDYKYIHQSPGVDVASYHDYGQDDTPIPGDQWNGLQFRLTQMKDISKPLIVGEAGMLASATVSGCERLDSRRDKIKAKIDAQFAAGVSGYLPWDWVQNNQGICTYDINPGDPALTLFQTYPAKMDIPTAPPTPTSPSSPSLSPSFIPTPTVGPTQIPSPTLAPVSQSSSVKLGGLDLSGYCTNLKQPGAVVINGIWKCGSEGQIISINLACQWQYVNLAYAKQDGPGNPYTWNCYLPPSATPVSTIKPIATPTPIPTSRPTQATQVLGGLDLSGYCGSRRLSGAVVINGIWKCGVGGVTINITSACQWQYKNSASYAKQLVSNNPYTWTCYK